MSETIPEMQSALYAALARAIAAAGAVSKDAKNTYSNYKYASAEAVIEEARAPLAAHGIAVLPLRWRVVPLPGGPVSGGGKASMYFADVEVTYLVTHKDGGHMECEATTPAVLDNGRPQDKAVATALTYSLGYFLRGLLLLPRVDGETDVDQRDDRNYEPPPRDGYRNGNGRAEQRTQRGPAPAPKAEEPTRTGPSKEFMGAADAIRRAETVAALREVGGMIAGLTLTAEERAELKDLYTARMKALWPADQTAPNAGAAA